MLGAGYWLLDAGYLPTSQQCLIKEIFLYIIKNLESSI